MSRTINIRRTFAALSMVTVACTTAGAASRLDIEIAVAEAAQHQVLDSANYHFAVTRLSLPTEQSAGYVCGSITPLGSPPVRSITYQSFAAALFRSEGARTLLGGIGTFQMTVEDLLQTELCN